MVSLSDFTPIPTDTDQYPKEFIQNNQVIKLEEDHDSVTIGAVTPDNTVVESLETYHSKKIHVLVISKTELASFLAKEFSSENDADLSNTDITNDKHLLDKIANDAPIINLVNSIIMDAINQSASDIHIESFSKSVTVRYRIDGHLVIDREIELEKFPAISSRIKIMANLNIMEKRLPQDGRISVNLGGDVVDLRVSFVPITRGESIVLRLLSNKKKPLSLEELGFTSHIIGMLKSMYSQPHGLILVTGPTGSGKTTTLNSILRDIYSSELKIISIEDPVEYEIDGIDQIQTNEKIGLDFTSILRRVLRQDPNIIMIGEIRDKETADLAVRASLTGHLVLSTLHTNDSLSVINRLINMGIEPYLLAGVLSGAIAQRLVRKICGKCKKGVEPEPVEKEIFRRHELQSPPLLYQGEGCSHCRGTGYEGRLAISEGFISNENIATNILDQKSYGELKQSLEKMGMKSLFYDGLLKVIEGVTTLSEVEKATVT